MIQTLQEEVLESFCMERSAVPPARPYRSPVAVLIDEDVVSAGETDTVIFHEIPGAVVAMASSEFRPVFGD